MIKRNQMITNLYFKFYKKYGYLPSEKIFDTLVVELNDKLDMCMWYSIRGELFDQLYYDTRGKTK